MYIFRSSLKNISWIVDLASHVIIDLLWLQLVIFSSVGALLHIVAGSVIVYNWRKILGPYYNNEFRPSKQYMDMFISGAVFTFANAVVFILEVFFIIKFSSKGTEWTFLKCWGSKREIFLQRLYILNEQVINNPEKYEYLILRKFFEKEEIEELLL